MNQLHLASGKWPKASAPANTPRASAPPRSCATFHFWCFPACVRPGTASRFSILTPSTSPWWGCLSSSASIVLYTPYMILSICDVSPCKHWRNTFGPWLPLRKTASPHPFRWSPSVDGGHGGLGPRRFYQDPYAPCMEYLHIFTNMCPKNHPNVGKYIPYMEHMGDELPAVFYDQRVGIRYKIGSWTSTKKESADVRRCH